MTISQVPLAQCCPSRSSRQQREASRETSQDNRCRSSHTRGMNTVLGHISCTFHTCAQLMRSSFFAYSATVDLEAPSVPQVAHPVESLRVQDVSMDPASSHRGQSGAHHAGPNRTHRPWECGQASACPQILPLQRERQTSNVDASFDLVLLGTYDVKTRIRLLKCGNVGLSRPRCNVFRQKVRSKKARKTWISEFSLSQMQQVGTIRRARENMNVRWNTAVGDLAFYVI